MLTDSMVFLKAFFTGLHLGFSFHKFVETFRFGDLGTWELGNLGTLKLVNLGTRGLGTLGLWELRKLGTWEFATSRDKINHGIS